MRRTSVGSEGGVDAVSADTSSEGACAARPQKIVWAVGAGMPDAVRADASVLSSQQAVGEAANPGSGGQQPWSEAGAIARQESPGAAAAIRAKATVSAAMRCSLGPTEP